MKSLNQQTREPSHYIPTQPNNIKIDSLLLNFQQLQLF